MWLKEGDANSKYLRSMMESRQRRNAISSTQVDGATVEGVPSVRQVVFTYFASHFKASNVERPGVDNLLLKMLSAVDR
jgi:hypothetical protein